MDRIDNTYGLGAAMPEQGDKFDVNLCKEIHRNIQRRIDMLERAVMEIKENLANRLPTWATVLIGLMGILVGVLGKGAFS